MTIMKWTQASNADFLIPQKENSTGTFQFGNVCPVLTSGTIILCL